MANCDVILQELIDDKLRLSQSDISACAKSRQWLLDRIANVIQTDQSGPQLYGSEKFVHFGSYFKGTKVANVDEYDVLVVIDSNNGQFSRSGGVIGSGLGSASPNHKYDSKFQNSDSSGVSPMKMLEWLQQVVWTVLRSVDGEYPLIDGSAVVAKIRSKDLAVDLVPAGIFSQTDDPRRNFYNIPDGLPSNGWTLTNPRFDIDRLNEVAAERDNLKNVIRLAKFVRDEWNCDVSSFAIESSAISFCCFNFWMNSLAQDTIAVFRSIANQIKAGRINDPWDSTNNLLKGNLNEMLLANKLDEIANAIGYQTFESDQSKAKDAIFLSFDRNQQDIGSLFRAFAGSRQF